MKPRKHRRKKPRLRLLGETWEDAAKRLYEQCSPDTWRSKDGKCYVIPAELRGVIRHFLRTEYLTAAKQAQIFAARRAHCSDADYRKYYYPQYQYYEQIRRYLATLLLRKFVQVNQDRHERALELDERSDITVIIPPA